MKNANGLNRGVESARRLQLFEILTILLLLVIGVQRSDSQPIQTNIEAFAGNHALGGTYSGDGGPATSAGLNYPRGISFGPQGNLLIADSGNGMVRIVSNGVISSIQYGDFSTLMGVAEDQSNNFYAASGDWGGLMEFQLQNLPYVSTIGDGYQPAMSVAVGNSGNLYCVDEYGATVSLRTPVTPANPNGTVTTIAGLSGTYFNLPGTWVYIFSSATVDAHGNVYVADIGDNSIFEIDTNDITTTIAGNGGQGYSGDGGPAVNAQLSSPSAVAVDSFGNLCIADTGNNVIRKVDTSGRITTVAGTGTQGYSGDNGPAVSAQLSNPSGLAFDTSGNLYISDTGNHVIREIIFPPTIFTSSSPSGGGTTSGGCTTNHGSDVTITATPASGYAFVNWTDGGTVVSTWPSYTFMVISNRTLVANFLPIDTTTTVSVSNSVADAWEDSGDPGVFTITREASVSIAYPLTVSVDFSKSTATADLDYPAINSQITIPTGANSTEVYVWPFQDNLAESNETVVLRLVGSSSYELSSASNATVTIHNNSATLPNPGNSGTNTFTTYQYGPGGGRITPTTSEWTTVTVDQPICGYVDVPTSGSGPFPVAFILHGNSYDPEGFRYLCDALASNGIIAVAVDATGNAPSNTTGNYNNYCGSTVFGENISQFTTWNDATNHTLYRKVDMSRIMLAGHSQGGPVVSQAASSLGGIKAIVSLDGQAFSPYLADNLFILLGAHGADQQQTPPVYDNWNSYDISNYPPTNAPAFRALTWIYGGVHGFFSSDYPTNGGSDAGDGQFLLSQTVQNNIVESYVCALAQATLLGQPEYLKFLQDYHFMASDLQSNLQVDLQPVVCTSEYQSTNRSFIDHFEIQKTPLPPYNQLATNIWNVANPATDGGTTNPPGMSSVYGRFNWSDLSRYFQVSFVPGQALNASNYTYLALRIGQKPATPGLLGVTNHLKIIVQDTNGNSASFGFALPQPDNPTGYPTMQTVRIPVQGLSEPGVGVDINHIAFIRLAPEAPPLGSSTGSVFFDDIQLSN